jgi:TolA-binding protein
MQTDEHLRRLVQSLYPPAEAADTAAQFLLLGQGTQPSEGQSTDRNASVPEVTLPGVLYRASETSAHWASRTAVEALDSDIRSAADFVQPAEVSAATLPKPAVQLVDLALAFDGERQESDGLVAEAARNTIAEHLSPVLLNGSGSGDAEATASLPGAWASQTAETTPDLRGNGILPSSPRAQDELAEQIDRLTSQIDQLRQADATNAETLAANTRALVENTSRQQTTSQSSGSGVGGVLNHILGGTLGIGSIVSGIASLFHHEGQDTPAPLVKLTLPPAIQYQSAISYGSTQPYAVDFNTLNEPRAVSSSAPGSGSPITVQVNAMDSRSFLDHSAEIAQAVRDALLHSHSLGDVISEL